MPGVPRRPAYEPRDNLQDGESWNSDRPRWREATTFDEALRIAASQQQHRLSRAVRRRLFEDGLTIEQLAEAMGHGYDQLWRKLAGTVPASPVDLNAWAAMSGNAGVAIAPDVTNVEVPWPVVRPPTQG